MHGVVLLAIFGFCLCSGDRGATAPSCRPARRSPARAGRRPCMPTRSIVFGAVILAAALWALAGLRATRPVPALARRGGASCSSRRQHRPRRRSRSDGVLEWQRWDPDRALGALVARPLRLGRQYGGIDFPKKETNRAAGHRHEAQPLLAGNDARPLRLATAGSSNRGSAVERAREREAAGRAAFADEARNRGAWVEARGGGGRLRDQHIIGAARRSGSRRLVRARSRSYGRARASLTAARSSEASATPSRATRRARASRPCTARGRVPERARALLPARAEVAAPVRQSWARGGRSGNLRGGWTALVGGVPRSLAAGRAARARRPIAVRRRGRDRGVAADDGRVRLRRAAALAGGRCLRSPISSPRASGATASTSRVRWP